MLKLKNSKDYARVNLLIFEANTLNKINLKFRYSKIIYYKYYCCLFPS